MYCRRCDMKTPRRQQGAALVVALFIFALCAALVVAMQGEFTRFYQRSANLLFMAQADAYLRGAEQLATRALIADFDSDTNAQKTRDDLTEFWARERDPYIIDGGWMRGKIIDLQGRFNLNSLAGKVSAPEGSARKKRFTAHQAQFIRLLQALGEPAVSQYDAELITQAVADWIDDDDRPYPDGAEDQYYYGLTPSYRPANRPMASVSELRAVAHMTPDIYEALRPFVTVWPAQAQSFSVNIHTAPATVLRSLNENDVFAPLSEAEGEALEDARDEEGGGFQDKQAFLDHQVFDGRRDQMSDARQLIGETSDWFLLEAEVALADRNMRLYSVLWRDKRNIWSMNRSAGGR